VKPLWGGLVSLGALVVAAFAAVPAPAWGAYPGANGMLAYTGVVDQSGESEIYTVSPMGGAPTQLTDSHANGAASWSADGRRIAYVHWGPPVGGVWVMRSNGTHEHPVIHTRSAASSPSFSPGGKRIVFADGHSLAIMRTDGTHLERLLYGYVERPTFSPNGKRIAFGGVPHGRRGPSKIWTIRRDGSHLRRLTKRGHDTDRSPDWRPDGRRIVYSHCDDADAARFQGDWSRRKEGYTCLYGDTYSVRADGSRKRRIHLADSAPVYSPAGDRIALYLVQWDNIFQDVFCTDIYTISSAGGDRRPVTHYCDGNPQSFTGVATRPSWQPLPGG
jgi:dipeptidyl aminopeptidase/acylaminoacyl peptidase